MQMMFLLDGMFSFNVINYIKVRLLDYEESVFYLPWEYIPFIVKCFI